MSDEEWRCSVTTPLGRRCARGINHTGPHELLAGRQWTTDPPAGSQDRETPE